MNRLIWNEIIGMGNSRSQSSIPITINECFLLLLSGHSIFFSILFCNRFSLSATQAIDFEVILVIYLIPIIQAVNKVTAAGDLSPNVSTFDDKCFLSLIIRFAAHSWTKHEPPILSPRIVWDALGKP